ncbi:MAG: hypothetical protein P9L99_04470 [Candidatus Lernaella stagnicola]|nr:hypothetical protein [Candidatus Lernaella stagnicola]
MNRRDFLGKSTAMFFTTLLTGTFGLPRFAIPEYLEDWRPHSPLGKDGPAPVPEITAVVDIIVPPDPEIPNDFKGSDYGGDWVLAATLGELGQYMAAMMLNSYARGLYGRRFMNCTAVEQMEAVKEWIREREDINPLLSDMLSGILTISMIGTYEENDPEAERELFESMNWYDPEDPTGTFRLPCEGYPDTRQFPVTLKKGLRDD